jgi:hypothetical protein
MLQSRSSHVAVRDQFSAVVDHFWESKLPAADDYLRDLRHQVCPSSVDQHDPLSESGNYLRRQAAVVQCVRKEEAKLMT